MSDLLTQQELEAADDQRRSGTDRRGRFDRRRSTRGLFERRALREGVTDDRRRRDRREQILNRIRNLFGFCRADDARWR